MDSGIYKSTKKIQRISRILKINFTKKIFFDIIIKLVEYLAVFLILVGTYLTAQDIVPWNKYVFIVANFLWLIIAISWKKSSLFVMTFIMFIMYVFGVVFQ